MSNIALILSVITGIAVVYFLKPSLKIVQLLLSFSGAYLLSITVLHLLPEVYHTQNASIGIYILLGLLIQLILDFFTKGAEHGHIHIHNKNTFPWVLLISLSIHAFMEGIPLANFDHSHSLLWAIVIHKIPIAIILATFFVQSDNKKIYAIFFLTVFSLMTPLGNISGEYLTIFSTYKNEITALIIGVFLHISTTILFESSKEHSFNLLKFVSVLVGIIVALLA